MDSFPILKRIYRLYSTMYACHFLIAVALLSHCKSNDDFLTLLLILILSGCSIISIELLGSVLYRNRNTLSMCNLVLCIVLMLIPSLVFFIYYLAHPLFSSDLSIMLPPNLGPALLILSPALIAIFTYIIADKMATRSCKGLQDTASRRILQTLSVFITGLVFFVVLHRFAITYYSVSILRKNFFFALYCCAVYYDTKRQRMDVGPVDKLTYPLLMVLMYVPVICKDIESLRIFRR